jgi:hypothetical protein
MPWQLGIAQLNNQGSAVWQEIYKVEKEIASFFSIISRHTS